MPNFCAINMPLSSDYVVLKRQRATLNDEATDYIYKSTEEILKKDQLRVVFVQNTEDTDIKKIGISKADTREEYMNWQTNASGQNVGYETISVPDDDMLGNKINTFGSINAAYSSLVEAYGIGGLD